MSAARPVVGITSYATVDARFGVWEEPVVLVPASYISSVEHAGGRPLVLPPTDADADAGAALDLLDALIVSGGPDLDPSLYGAEPHPATDPVRPQRDRFELRLLGEALERDMPVLAVCRGSQVLNVARGGDLVQHLPDVLGHERHKHTPGQFADHDVALEAGSRLGRVLGGERAPVKSHHHQGFGRLGEALRPVAWADDGTVEALEDPDRRFALGVLWHPEEGEDKALFTALVEEARRYREERLGAGA